MRKLKWLDYDLDEQSVRQRLLRMVHLRETEDIRIADKLQTIYLFLTRRCNLACQHCYIEGVGPARDKDFDLASIKKIIERALPYGLRKVKVSGGEPFVRNDALDILKYLDSLNLEIVLETNGTLFHEDTITELAKLKQFSVFISLDHSEGKEHDEFRGALGAYKQTVRVLQALGRTEIDSVVTTTANRFNYRNINDIFEQVFGWGVKRHRTLLNIHPLGNARDHLDNAITMEEAEILIQSIVSSRHFESGRCYLTLPPALMPLPMLVNLHSCGWGQNVIGVLSTGEISMCSASYDDDNMIGGNAFEDDLIDIWKKSALFTRLRTVADGDVKGVCGNCIFYSTCRGVCRMSSYSHYGDVDAPYPLCQEIYNSGAFPAYALIDPQKDCRYGGEAIAATRPKTQSFVQISSKRKVAA